MKIFVFGKNLLKRLKVEKVKKLKYYSESSFFTRFPNHNCSVLSVNSKPEYYPSFRRDKKGNWLNTIIYYDESKAAQDVKDLIGIAYRDYKITGMNEIKEGITTFDIVYLENATGYKQICIFRGEAYLYQEFSKQ